MGCCSSTPEPAPANAKAEEEGERREEASDVSRTASYHQALATAPPRPPALQPPDIDNPTPTGLATGPLGVVEVCSEDDRRDSEAELAALELEQENILMRRRSRKRGSTQKPPPNPIANPSKPPRRSILRRSLSRSSKKKQQTQTPTQTPTQT